MVTDSFPELPAPYTPPDCCSSVFRAIRSCHMGCLVRYPTSKLLEVDGRGKSVLHLAAKQGNHEVVDYILKEAPVLLDFHNQTQETPLLIAAAFGHFKLVEKFLQGPQTETLRRALHRDVNGTSCLMAALARNDNDIALYLLRRFGRKLATLPNEVNMMPIHIAASKGNLEFLRIVVKFDHTMVNHQDVYGCTPCVYAVQGGSLASLRYLVEKAKANIGCLTSKGQSLLHVAALSSQFNMCRWLVQKNGITGYSVADPRQCQHNPLCFVQWKCAKSEITDGTMVEKKKKIDLIATGFTRKYTLTSGRDQRPL